MKYMVLIALLAATICVPAFGKGQKDDFQAAKIVQVEKLQPPDNPNVNAPNSAPLDPGISLYNVYVQVGDTVYTCRLKSYDPNDSEWIAGNQVQARVAKRVLYLKRSSGEVEEARIVGKKKADAQ
jgi:hypothetical protein